MKALKYVAIGLGIVVALVLVLIAILLAMFDSARIKTELADAVHTRTQRTLKIDGDLGLFFWPKVGIKVGHVSLSEFKSEQEFAAIDGARVSVAVLPLLSKKIVVDAVELDGARATFVKHKDGTLNIADLMDKGATKDAAKEGAAAAPAAPLQVSVASVKVANAHLVWRDEQSGETSTLSGFDFATGRIVGDTATQTWTVDAPTLAVAGKRGDDSVAVKLAVEKLALAGDEARTLSLDKIEGRIELISPKMPMKSLVLPLTGDLRVELAKEAASGQLATGFDESTVALKFDVAKFAPLDLGFALDIDRLNVDKYLPPEKKAAPVDGAGAPPAKEAKIDLSALKALNAHGTLRIGQLQAKNLKMADIKAKIALAAGKLDAPHSMSLYRGSLSGALSVHADGNAIALRENLTGIDINPLLNDLADQDLIEGHGDVRLDVTTRGDTVTAMKQALGGNAAVALKNGAFKGINLAQSFRELKARFSSREDAEQQAKATDSTDFSELTASFRIADGVARNDDLSAKSPFLRLGGAGEIDIGRSSLDYLLKATVVETSGGQGGKDLEYLRGVTVPVRASGPFDRLAYKIEFGSVALEGALKNKLDEKKQELREDLKQRARDALTKGLLGR